MAPKVITSLARPLWHWLRDATPPDWKVTEGGGHLDEGRDRPKVAREAEQIGRQAAQRDRHIHIRRAIVSERQAETWVCQPPKRKTMGKASNAMMGR